MTRFYLLLSATVLFVIALGYGIAPGFLLPQVLKITVDNRDLTHVFRAMMGLYLALVSLWVAGAFRPDLTRAAVLSEVFFMAGLAVGRLFSVIVDGLPSPLLTVGMILEFTLAVWGCWLLKTKYSADREASL